MNKERLFWEEWKQMLGYLEDLVSRTLVGADPIWPPMLVGTQKQIGYRPYITEPFKEIPVHYRRGKIL